MKQLVFTFLFITIFLTSFAKKDTNAWKKETTLEQQYSVFKKNLNFWNGSLFLKEDLLNEFYSSLSDTINNQKKLLKEKQAKINDLKTDSNSKDTKIKETEAKLEKSVKFQNSISFFGMNINKHVYSIILFLIIAGALFLAGFVFLLYKKSLSTTQKLRKDYDELKEEYEAHKKSALERYTQTNMELHRTRLELKKKK